MRTAAIIYILLSVAANFIFDNPAIFVLAMFSFPVLIWLLLKKNKKLPAKSSSETTSKKQEEE